jgi:uncharacterized protein YndB with AHSA1/START domain
MATTNSEVFIARSADEVWKLFGDFHGIKGWFPGLEEVRSEGDTRYIGMGPGVEVAETLVGRDDAARTLSYTVTAEVLPTTKYVTTCSVTEADGGCVARMSADIEPDEIAPMIQGVYDNAVAGLASNFA